MSQYLINPFAPGVPIPPVVGNGAWIEIGRTTLGAPATFMDVLGLPKKDYLWVLFHLRFVGPGLGSMNFNLDFGPNYATRMNENGFESVDANAVQVEVGNNQVSGEDEFGSYFIDNTLEKSEHLVEGRTVGSGNIAQPSGSAPTKLEAVSKWLNPNGEFIDAIRVDNLIAGNLDTGSEVVVLGWDRKDTHDETATFWQHLGFVLQPGNISSMTMPTFAKRKYILIKAWINGNTNERIDGQLGDGVIDTGLAYSQRRSLNGVDSSLAGINGWETDSTTTVQDTSVDELWVNRDGSEKLGMSLYQAPIPTPAPNRIFQVQKYNVLAGQFDEFRYIRDIGTGIIVTGSRIDIWGHD